MEHYTNSFPHNLMVFRNFLVLLSYVLDIICTANATDFICIVINLEHLVKLLRTVLLGKSNGLQAPLKYGGFSHCAEES